MTKKVCVSVQGLHLQAQAEGEQAEDKSEKIEVMNIGTYAKRGGKHWVRYEEPNERGDLMTSTLLKFNEHELELLTRGQIGSHIVFTQGQKNLSYYETPFGGMNMGVDTYDFSVEETEDCISVDIRYGLEINLDFISTCKVHIEIASVNEL